MKNRLLHYTVLLGKFTIYCYVIQIFFLNTLLANEARGQNAKSVKEVSISIDLRDVKLDHAFKIIESSTDYDFIFNNRDLNKSQRISFSGQNATVEEILLDISRQSNLIFKQVNNRISVKKRNGKAADEIEVMIVQRDINGKVTDETGEPLPGATVLVKGTTNGSVTDIEGNFSLSVPDDAQTLVVSFVGYQTQEVEIGNRSVIDITLQTDVSSLSEVVVVGYGTQERARVTGAISSVSSDEINVMPITSPDQALQGRAAGVTVTNTGAPGVNPLVRIRGLGTVNNNNPLYVIDGMPAGGLNEINPSDIESIEILKDASAAAIYGSRAANGVIMITTKKGKKGKTNINVDSYYGVQNAWKKLDLLNREQYLEYGTELLTNAGEAIPGRFNDLGEFANNDTDWQDAMFRPASIQDYNVSVSGGGENSIFNVSGGYFDQEGIMVGANFKRYSFRANSEFTAGRFKFGETLTLAFSERRNEPYSGGRSQIEHMIKMVPYIPVRDENFIGGFRATDNIDGTDPENPVLNATLRGNTDENMKILGTAYASLEIIEGLNYKLLLGVDMNFGYNNQFTPIFFPSDSYHLNPTADLLQNRRDYISPLISNQLSYDKTFGDHTLNLLGVIERQTFTQRNTQAAGETGLSSAIDVMDIAENAQVGGTRTEYAILSYVARVNYDYAGKYMLSASLRRDGGARFGEEKWGTFPSVSLGWRISEENFLSQAEFISELKLRGSWGITGNDNIGNYRYQQTISTQSPYVLGADGNLVPGFTTRALANPAIQWETTMMTNLGLDVELFDGQVRASIEYFNNETQDMLLQVPIPSSLGYDVPPFANVGSVVNKGFELTGGYFNNSGDFQWSINGNISFINNELTSLDIGNTIAGSQFEGYPVTFTEENNPIAFYYGWVTDGIFQTNTEAQNAPTQNLPDDQADYDPTQHTAAGDIRFKDLNDDGVINDDDRTNIGHFLPDFAYGLNGSANFRNVDFTLFIQGVSGNEILNTNLYDLEGMPRLFNAGVQVLDAWTPEATNTDIPRAITGDPNLNSRLSTRYIEDGSYLRVKNLTLGYTIPSNMLDNFGNGFIRNLRVYFTAQNLLTITNYSGYDPEIGARPDLASNPTNATLNSGVDWGQYPQARTFLGGIQIGF